MQTYFERRNIARYIKSDHLLDCFREKFENLSEYDFFKVQNETEARWVLDSDVGFGYVSIELGSEYDDFESNTYWHRIDAYLLHCYWGKYVAFFTKSTSSLEKFRFYKFFHDHRIYTNSRWPVDDITWDTTISILDEAGKYTLDVNSGLYFNELIMYLLKNNINSGLFNIRWI